MVRPGARSTDGPTGRARSAGRRNGRSTRAGTSPTSRRLSSPTRSIDLVIVVVRPSSQVGIGDQEGIDRRLRTGADRSEQLAGASSNAPRSSRRRPTPRGQEIDVDLEEAVRDDRPTVQGREGEAVFDCCSAHQCVIDGAAGDLTFGEALEETG